MEDPLRLRGPVNIWLIIVLVLYWAMAYTVLRQVFAAPVADIRPGRDVITNRQRMANHRQRVRRG